MGLIAPLGGLVVILLFYMQRISGGAAASAWAGAWAMLYLAGTINSVTDPPTPLLAVGHAIGAMFPAMLFAGAVAFRDDGPLPRLPLAGGVLLGSLRFGLTISGYETLSNAMTVPLELPFAAGATYVTWQAARRRRSFPEQVLPPTLAMLAVVNTVDPVARILGMDLVPILIAWDATAFSAALLQIAAFVERGRDRERRLRLERDLLYRVARTGAESVARQPALDAVARAVAEAQWFDVFGIWLISADGRRFERAARMRTAEAPRPRYDFLPADAALLAPVLADTEPVLLAERRGGVLPSRFQKLGLGDVAAMALRVHDHALGIVIAGQAFDRRFGDDERRVLGSITRELALVLARVDATEERERQAAALAEEKRHLRALVEAVPVGITLVDRNERVRMMSRVSAEHFHVGDPESWTGRPVVDTVHAYASRLCPISAAQLAADLARHETGAFDGFEIKFIAPEERVLRVSARPVSSEDGEQLGRVFVSLDVTAEREVAERLQRAQRMETLGTLAGGIAHDFNNQLTAILGNARVVADALSPASPARAALADLEAAAEHCAELTRGLLDLARQGPVTPQPVAVEKLLREVEALLRASLPPDVQLHVHAVPGAFAHADPAQLRRVLTNLALNARDAVGARGEIEIAAAFAPRGSDAEPPRLLLRVRDTGAGMDADTLERLFDPFFTTKPAGQGTGLGLAIVDRIVASHGAAIEVASELGRGTEFRLLWPVATEVPRAAESRADASAAGPECVLLAEDEPAVRRLARSSLERRGYRVLEACDGDEAIALFEKHRDEIDLLVLDLAMPRRSGLEALAAIRESVPEIGAVLTSGHGGLDDPTALPAHTVALPKPYRPDDLATAIRTALDRPQPKRAATTKHPNPFPA
jgi:signal transduction histidine kinase/ActR/RegA family two-component response regulator